MITKKVLIGGLNTDDAHALLDTKDYIGALNARYSSVEGGDDGFMQPIDGNSAIVNTETYAGSVTPFVLPAGTNTTIASCDDQLNDRVIFFNYNSNGKHGIYCHTESKIYTVLLSSQVEGGFGFTGAYIDAMSIISNLLYWTDGVNEQRKINIDAGIKANHGSYVPPSEYQDTVAYQTLFVGDYYLPSPGTWTPGTYALTFTGGTGSGATGTAVIAGGAITLLTINCGGSGYTIGDTLTGTGGITVRVTGLVKQNVINIVKDPPLLPLGFSKVYDSSLVTNHLKDKSFFFRYRFVYKDYENSVFSPMSLLCNYNLKIENYNKASVSIPASQKIGQDVLRIEFATSDAFSGVTSIFKTIELTDKIIDDHNKGVSVISFFYYSDTYGSVVSTSDASKTFDSIPLTSETLEIARDRLHLGNNVDGYETPLVSSLSGYALSDSSGVTYKWYEFSYKVYEVYSGVTVDSFLVYFVKITGSTVDGYYAYRSGSSWINSTPLPATGSYTTDLVFAGNLDYELFAWIEANIAPYDPTNEAQAFVYKHQLSDPITISGVVSGTAYNKPFLKNDSLYRYGIVFFDHAGRKSNVLSLPSMEARTGGMTYSTTNTDNKIFWSLDNSSPDILSEIPQWAEAYSIVCTKNLTTTSFVQFRADDLCYLSKNASGDYVANKAPYLSSFVGIGIGTQHLYSYGMGYSLNVGDQVRVYMSTGETAILGISGIWGNYIVCELYNIGDLTNALSPKGKFEVFTPYVQVGSELYFDTGNIYSILNPKSSTRSYSVISGSILGDVYGIERSPSSIFTAYVALCMSPSDSHWDKWNRNLGRPNIILKGKKLRKKVAACYSDTIILGTEYNGLSSFSSDGEYYLPYEIGSLRKLTFVNKTGQDGSIMLGVGDQNTVSIHLGETQVFDNKGQSLLSSTSGVVGNMNILRGGFGTINPESVCRYKGKVYWLDASKGSVVYYDVNGLFPVSDIKMSKYFLYVSELIKDGTISRVVAGIDPYTDEVLFHVPRTKTLTGGTSINYDRVVSSSVISHSSGDSNITIAVQPDRECIIETTSNCTITHNTKTVFSAGQAYSFCPDVKYGVSTIINVSAPASGTLTIHQMARNMNNLYDGQNGTIVFSEPNKRWTSVYSFRPESLSMINNTLVTFKDGIPYVHGVTSNLNRFYGLSHDMSIGFVHSEAGNNIKTYRSVAVEGDTPDNLSIRTDSPNAQASNLYAADYKNIEGVKYAPVYRDGLSPNTSGSYVSKMYGGDVMRGENCKFMLSFLQPSTYKKIKFVNIGYQTSSGHSI